MANKSLLTRWTCVALSVVPIWTPVVRGQSDAGSSSPGRLRSVNDPPPAAAEPGTGSASVPTPTTGRAAPPVATVPFKPEEVEQLVAPIALYPDSLLAQVLMASTYPLEVV